MIVVEVSAAAGVFCISFMQRFTTDVYLDAFLDELHQQGLTCEIPDRHPLQIDALVPPDHQILRSTILPAGLRFLSCSQCCYDTHRLCIYRHSQRRGCALPEHHRKHQGR